MNRRHFLAAALAVAAAPALAAPSATRTRWVVRTSEGFDAICFLGALSGGKLYTSYYADELATFRPKLPQPIVADIVALWNEAARPVGLLGPFLTIIFSHGHDASIGALVDALGDPERMLRPDFATSPYWDTDQWNWLAAAAPRLHAIFAAMRDAGFAAYRRSLVDSVATKRLPEVRAALAAYDVVRWQEKLTGRRFDPAIEVVLLHFSKPHGIKVQGQTFLQALDYDTATTVRIAAHEMLHPPVDMKGKAATAALAVLARDPLLQRIVKDHDPGFGYTTLDGLFDEDLVQALDQLISEQLGVARDPAQRWLKADDGMHVLAAGFYALLKRDRWAETGGDLERWLLRKATDGSLAPESLHGAAAPVLKRPLDELWPVAAS